MILVAELDRKRKPRRLYAVAAAVGGFALLVFELRRLHETGPEGWFWLFVAALMIVLGLVGALDRDSNGVPPAR